MLILHAIFFYTGTPPVLNFVAALVDVIFFVVVAPFCLENKSQNVVNYLLFSGVIHLAGLYILVYGVTYSIASPILKALASFAMAIIWSRQFYPD